MHRFLLFALLVAVGFVWLSSGNLPTIVASHFGPDGNVNGFMSRRTYMAFMLGAVVAIPMLVGLSGHLARFLPLQLLNLPNKQYWLAPDRRAATLESISSMCVPYALVLAIFLCFVHWLVVQANAVRPPKLAQTPMLVGLAVFTIASLVWLSILFRRFGRVP
jgi:hypothetical protein